MYAYFACYFYYIFSLFSLDSIMCLPMNGGVNFSYALEGSEFF